MNSIKPAFLRSNKSSSRRDARFETALTLHQSGDFDAARKMYRQILRKEPGNAHALHLLGLMDFQQGDYAGAMAQISRAINLNPRNPAFHSNLANVHQRLGDQEEALSGYARAIALKPDYAEALYNQGVTLQALGRYAEAAASHKLALTFAPSDADTHCGLGAALQALGQHLLALEHFDRALALNPASAVACCHRGNVLRDLGRLAEASYSSALALQPDIVEAYANRGHVLQEQGDYELSFADYKRALELQGDDPDARYLFLRGSLLHVRMSLCAWDGFEADIARLETDILDGRLCTPCFPLLTMIDSPEVQLAAAETWVSTRILPRPVPDWRSVRPPDERIRLGYFSADFHQHATSHLMAQLFEVHDRKRFELVAFSFGPQRIDPMRNRLELAFDRFLDVSAQGDQEVAQLARDLGIDIAIDLKGFTRDQRADIFAWRAAPVQVSYLGYPGTLGCPHMDYLIADRVLVTPDTRPHYREKLIWMPDSYQVNDSSRPLPELAAERHEQGLPEGSFVFACFNNAFKLTPQVFGWWMDILARVPESVLWLLVEHPVAQANLRRAAATRGLDPERLVFANRVSPEEHLARHACADLFLDTLPCNAHTTASDALWSGLPVVTCRGRSFAGRVAASLLHAVGLPELVTDSSEAYIELAISLAKDPERLSTLGDTLRSRRRTASLFDAPRFARHLEQAFAAVHQRHLMGLAPEDIAIDCRP
jgi:protein O-GlcNAc transferase